MSAPLQEAEVLISEGLTLAEIRSVDACDQALLTLARDINRIEEQLADESFAGAMRPAWAERAESALRFKRAVRQIVTERKAAYRRSERAAASQTRERVLLNQLQADWPGEFDQSLRSAQAQHPELWP